MAACAAFDPSGPYVGNLVGLVDCHSLALGADGWRALSTGSSFGIALSGLLTIYLALWGYRILLGDAPTLREGVSAAVRIGIVLALATQWSAFRPLVYDVATHGPDEIAGAILTPGGLGGENRTSLNDRVQAVNVTLGALIRPEVPSSAVAPPDAAAANGTDAGNTVHKPAPPALPNTELPFEASRSVALTNLLLLVSTAAGAISVRVVIALMLALAPLFVAFLLFDATRGLFASWLRVLAGAALGVVAVSAVTALELAILEPQVLALNRLLTAAQPLGGLPDEMQATAALFALVMLAALVATARATAGFGLPKLFRPVSNPFMVADRQGVIGALSAGSAGQSPEHSRADVIADAARTAERRDAQQTTGVMRIQQQTQPLGALQDVPGFALANRPLGQSGRRTARGSSPSAARRDDRG